MSRKLLSKLSRLKRKVVSGVVLASLGLMSAPAMAFTAPSTGDLGYSVYDTLINEGVNGPIGFTIALLGLIFGVWGLTQRNWFLGVGSFAAITIMVAGNSIVTGLGAIV